jgi:hypothetical protein
VIVQLQACCEIEFDRIEVIRCLGQRQSLGPVPPIPSAWSQAFGQVEKILVAIGWLLGLDFVMAVSR